MLWHIVAVAAILTTLAGARGAGGEQDATAAAVADRLRNYVRDLEPKLSALVADERFEQSIT
uniref:hypothetical protein n=1 Tax=Salmonella sp. SAL4359 TaxID=3159880 RepID=UPI00397A2D15